MPPPPRPPLERVPLTGPWEEIRREDGRIEWSHDLPFRSVNYWASGRQKPVGMVLRTGDQKQTFKELLFDSEDSMRATSELSEEDIKQPN